MVLACLFLNTTLVVAKSYFIALKSERVYAGVSPYIITGADSCCFTNNVAALLFNSFSVLHRSGLSK